MNQDNDKLNIAELLESCPTDDKGRKIVPDEIMEAHYKELPDGTRNESRTKRVYNGGTIGIFGNSEEDKQVQRSGGYALQAALKQRRTFAETIEYMLAQKADPASIEKYGLPAGSTKQDVIMAAAFGQAGKGNIKALSFLRDTIGQMPINRQEITAEITAEDKALIERVSARLQDNDKR